MPSKSGGTRGSWPLVIAAVCLAITASAACASAVKPGASAPDFAAPSVIAGRPETFRLADARKHGAVVLYFFPQAFSAG